MENQIMTVETSLSENELQSQVNIIQKVMSKVMQKDVHYGVVPGCGSKPTLLKAGSEKILTTFQIAVDPIVEDLSTDDEIIYRVIVRGIYRPTGVYVGGGVGVCSSGEEKYKWRKAVCKEEFEATPENRRRIKWQSSGGQVMQVRVEPANIANTVLKMAKKRAQVDMTLTVTAASDIFTQDIEELADEVKPATKNGQSNEKPKKYELKTPDAPATEKQIKLIHTLASKKNISSERIKARAVAMFKKDSSKDLTMAEASQLIEYYQNYTGEPEAIPEATPEDFGVDGELPY